MSSGCFILTSLALNLSHVTVTRYAHPPSLLLFSIIHSFARNICHYQSVVVTDIGFSCHSTPQLHLADESAHPLFI